MSRRNIYLIVKIIIGVLIISFIFKLYKFDVEDIITAFKNAKKINLLLAGFLLIPNLLVQLFKWRFLLRTVLPEVGLSESLISLFGGITIGLITPGRIGEVGRALFIKHANQLKIAGLAAIDKIYGLIVITIGGTLGILFLLISLYIKSVFLITPLVLLMGIAVILIIYISFHPKVIQGFFYNLKAVIPYRGLLTSFLSSFDNFDKSAAKTILGLGVILYLIVIAQFLLLAKAFENLPFLWGFSSSSVTLLAKSLLPFSFGDLGIREASSIYFFTQFGIKAMTAFNASILLFTINVLIPSIIGAFFIPKLGPVDRKI